MNIVRNLKIASIWVAALALILSLGSCSQKNEAAEKQAQLQQENQNLVARMEEQRSTIDEMMQTFEEIEYNLDLIKQKEEMVEMNTAENELNDGTRKTVVKDIQLINTLLTDSRERVETLQRKLNQSGIQMQSFRDKVNRLTQQLDQRDQTVAELKNELEAQRFEIQDLQVNMDSLTAKLEVQKSINELQDKEMHQAYIATGSIQDLENRGIVAREGGVLWFGRTKTIRDDLPLQQFQAIDIRELNQLPVNARKAELITEHPEGSYKFLEDQDQIAALEITDPTAFWRVSDYLVLEVK